VKQQWAELEQRFSRLTRRERAILFAGGLALLLIVGFSLVDSSIARQRALVDKIDKARASASMAATQVETIMRQLAENPDARAQARVAQLTEETRELDAQMAGINRNLVPPQQMAQILQKMLTRNARVKLVRLKTLPVSYLTELAHPEESANVYKHGMELTLQGRYLDVLSYLDELESLPWQMFWARAQMDASGYPAVRMTVTVYTLSLDKEWLVV
jgi:MSHA biogenesis protein MshJ